jgi:hypothetical protein
LAPLGEVAQLVEHTAENRGVAGSIPALAMNREVHFLVSFLQDQPSRI